MQAETWRRWIFRLCAVGFVACWVISPAAGVAGTRAAAAKAGKEPDFSGIWVVRGNDLDEGVPAFDPFRPIDSKNKLGFLKPPEPKPQYAAAFNAYQKRQEAIDKGDSSVTDFGALCFPPGMPKLTQVTFAMEILKTPGQITLLFEWNSQIRRIFVDGRKHPRPEDLEVTYNGHSIGHWEGDTLVVDTIAFKQRPEGLPFSGQARITERFRLLDENTLEDQVVLEDPVTLMAPWKARWVYKRRPELQMMEYVCEDNNRNTGTGQIAPAPQTR